MATNKEIVLRVLAGAFIDRDPTVVERYFTPDYIQHNPLLPDGPAAIPPLIKRLGPDFAYEPGLAVEQGDFVMVHGRYRGWAGKTMIAVDIFRVDKGRVAEHWDVMQEEVPQGSTVSGNPMFQVPGPSRA